MGFEVRLAEGTNGYVSPDDLIRLIDGDTAVVCISDVEYSTGQRYDVTKLAEAAHRHGALLVVDASQSAGGLPIDAPSLGVDALVAASYKWLCGPFGVAVMYLAPHLQGRLDPGLVGFRSHRNMWDLKADRLVFPETAKRFEFSTMAYGCAVGLTTSIVYLLQIGVDRIFDRNRRLADQLIEGLRERNADVISPQNEEERTSIVTARFPGADPRELAEHLSSRQVIVSARRDAVRFSPHLYNEPDDITQALEEIDRFLKT
jgi:selenocysteine lyase/cysteine desulfurase